MFVQVIEKIKTQGFIPWFFIGMFTLYLLVGLIGYGNDNDSYLIIRAGQHSINHLEYRASRGQGALIPEIFIGLTSQYGGHIFANTLSAMLGVATLLVYFSLLMKKFEKPIAFLVTVLVALNPYFFIAASSSMDYIYSLFFIVVAIYYFSKHKINLATLFLAFGVSARFSNVLIAVSIWIFALIVNRNLWQHFLKAGLVGMFAVVLLFFPVYKQSNYTFQFLTYAIGDWNRLEYAARFFYKNVYLFGLLPFLLITGSILVYLFRSDKKISLLEFMGIIIVILQEILFLKIPLEISYLLPIVLVVYPIFVISTSFRKSIVVFLILLTGVYNLINLDILQPVYDERGTTAIDAQVGLFLEAGPLLSDISRRVDSKQYYFDYYNIPQK